MTAVDELFDAWLGHYGPQAWWPQSEGSFEIMVGAVLVQRTSWTNAARALERLRRRRLLDDERLAELAEGELETLIEPAGFYRIKAKRLLSLARSVAAAGGVEGLAGLGTNALRERLLAIHGVGAETADAILLYAFDRPVVVVDAYLRRILGRVHRSPRLSDETIRNDVLACLDDAQRLNELHALAVAHAKESCRATPTCADCCVRMLCRSSGGAAAPIPRAAARRTRRRAGNRRQ